MHRAPGLAARGCRLAPGGGERRVELIVGELGGVPVRIESRDSEPGGLQVRDHVPRLPPGLDPGSVAVEGEHDRDVVGSGERGDPLRLRSGQRRPAGSHGGPPSCTVDAHDVDRPLADHERLDPIAPIPQQLTGLRDLKTTLLLRPVFHRLENRIRAHVLICCLALLLIRVAENRTGTTWAQVSRELDRLAAVTLTGPAGTVVQTTEPTDDQRRFLTACKVALPPRISSLSPR